MSAQEMLGQKETLVVATAAIVASWISTGIAASTKDTSIKFNSTLWSWGLSGGAGIFLALVFFKGAGMDSIRGWKRITLITLMLASIVVPPALMAMVYGTNSGSIHNYWAATMQEAKGSSKPKHSDFMASSTAYTVFSIIQEVALLFLAFVSKALERFDFLRDKKGKSLVSASTADRISGGLFAVATISMFITVIVCYTSVGKLTQG